jgi:hypothetical protein
VSEAKAVATIRLARSLRGRSRRRPGSSADHRVLASVGSVSDARDNALAVVE